MVLLIIVTLIERFSFECRKVIGFGSTTLHDWLIKLALLFHPIRSKRKTNRDSLAYVFPRFAPATCNYFWLVHCIVYVLCDWLEWLLWLKLKCALNAIGQYWFEYSYCYSLKCTGEKRFKKTLTLICPFSRYSTQVKPSLLCESW